MRNAVIPSVARNLQLFLVAVGLVACQDLEVTNPNAPDARRGGSP